MTEPATAEPPSPIPVRARLRSAGTGAGRPGGHARETEFEAPRPLRTTALVLAPLVLPAALWAFGVLSRPVALGLGASVVVLALVQGCRGGYDLRRSRRLGDALLHAHPDRPLSALAAWRSAELTSPRNRRELARRVRRLRRETETCLSLGSPRVDGAVLETSLVLLRRLERRLELSPGPVSPRGMLEVEALAAGELGPLSCPERAGSLPTALVRALAALELPALMLGPIVEGLMS